MKRFALQTKRGVLTTLAIFTVLGASLLCPSNAFASVRMYVIWQPVQNGGWQRADGGSTIGGVFHVRVVVQPNSGYLYGGASVISNSVTELADHHAGQTTMGNFAQVSPNSSYGDPTSNVSVLQSEPVFLPHNATYRLWVRVHYLTYYSLPPYPLIPNVEEQEIQVTMNNLVLVDSRSEPYFVWKPLEVPAPPPQPANVVTEDPVLIGPTVPFSVQIQHAQSGACTLRLEIFTSENNQTPILVKEFTNVPRPGVWQWEWDGKLADGSTAPRLRTMGYKRLPGFDWWYGNPNIGDMRRALEYMNAQGVKPLKVVLFSGHSHENYAGKALLMRGRLCLLIQLTLVARTGW